jgi:hypothetical protein
MVSKERKISHKHFAKLVRIIYSCKTKDQLTTAKAWVHRLIDCLSYEQYTEALFHLNWGPQIEVISNGENSEISG